MPLCYFHSQRFRSRQDGDGDDDDYDDCNGLYFIWTQQTLTPNKNNNSQRPDTVQSQFASRELKKRQKLLFLFKLKINIISYGLEKWNELILDELNYFCEHCLGLAADLRDIPLPFIVLYNVSSWKTQNVSQVDA